MNTRWNYKGLQCSIVSSGSGYIYTVLDIGLITREPMTFIYGGSPNKVTKEDVESKIAIKIKEGNLKISTQCHNAFEAHRLGRCPFANVCDEPACKLTDWSETVKELETEMNTLEDEMNRMVDLDDAYEDLQDEYTDLQTAIDDIIETVELNGKMSEKLEHILEVCKEAKTW